MKKLIAILIIVLLIVVFSPFVTIWALNTVFETSIPCTFATWFAVVWLCGLFAVGSGTTKK